LGRGIAWGVLQGCVVTFLEKSIPKRCSLQIPLFKKEASGYILNNAKPVTSYGCFASEGASRICGNFAGGIEEV